MWKNKGYYVYKNDTKHKNQPICAIFALNFFAKCCKRT